MNDYDANLICDDINTAKFFKEVTNYTNNYKAIANLILGPVKQYLNDNNVELINLNLNPKHIAELILLIDNRSLNFSVASTKIVPLIIKENKSVIHIAEELNLIQVSDTNELDIWINQVFELMPDKIDEYKKGKKGLIGLFVGEIKKLSKGKADPKIVTELLNKKLNS